jgi:hypothetical protein
MQRLKILVLILMTVVATLGVGGCQKQETGGVKKQIMPLVGSPASPLPTPNVQASPLKK